MRGGVPHAAVRQIPAAKNKRKGLVGRLYHPRKGTGTQLQPKGYNVSRKTGGARRGSAVSSSVRT